MPSGAAQIPMPRHCWAAIENEAQRVLSALLTARRLCDVVVTDDWSRSALPLGKAERVDLDGQSEAKVYLRQARPLIELRVPFHLEREVIRELDRHSPVPDLRPVIEAARSFAELEDHILFEGIEGHNAPGLLRDAETQPMPVHGVEDLPAATARALQLLHERGVGGPYCFVSSTSLRTQLLSQMTPGGLPLLDQLRRSVEFTGEASPALPGALVCSRRGGDFRLHLGRGAHVVFEWQDANELHFSLVQSMALEFGGREAIVVLEDPAARVPVSEALDPLTVRGLAEVPQSDAQRRRRIEAGARVVNQHLQGAI